MNPDDRTRFHNPNTVGDDDCDGHQAVGEPQFDAHASQGTMRDDLLEVIR